MREQTLTFSTNGLEFETPILEAFQNMCKFPRIPSEFADSSLNA